MRRFIYSLIIIFLFLGLFFYKGLEIASGVEMSSANYKIQNDSINIGGIENSTSSNYKISDTIGEIGTGELSSDTYNIYAGYRQMDETYIAISSAGNINLSPNIGGVAGGIANGSGIWTVKTDSAAGYNFSVRATSTPAMQSAGSDFADYTPASEGVPDYNWNIAAANSEFGFSPYNSSSQIAKYNNSGSECNAGSLVTDGNCWFGLTISNEQIVNKTSRTEIDGEDTKINFRAEVGGLQDEGSYTATVVITAVVN